MECKVLFLFAVMLFAFILRGVEADYIWHNGEIPYTSDMRCYRGSSYYTNHPAPQEALLGDDDPPGLVSIIDYPLQANKCYFCVCHTSGFDIKCIKRRPLFCEYYRTLRDPETPRNLYREYFKDDWPSYFRHLSFRVRRTMDGGIFDYLDSGGDALCCNHEDGHRRRLHDRVRTRVRHFKRKTVPKENLLSGGPGGDYVDFLVNNDK